MHLESDEAAVYESSLVFMQNNIYIEKTGWEWDGADKGGLSYFNMFLPNLNVLALGSWDYRPIAAGVIEEPPLWTSCQP